MASTITKLHSYFYYDYNMHVAKLLHSVPFIYFVIAFGYIQIKYIGRLSAAWPPSLYNISLQSIFMYINRCVNKLSEFLS